MDKSGNHSPSPTRWKVLYQEAFHCMGKGYEKKKKIAEAENAIIERTRELFHHTDAGVQWERAVMEEAMYALRAWKAALEIRNRAA